LLIDIKTSLDRGLTVLGKVVWKDENTKKTYNRYGLQFSWVSSVDILRDSLIQLQGKTVAT